MKVILATGIYPPEIGGPATYVRELAGALRAKGAQVSIVTFGDPQPEDERDGVTRVSRRGGPFLRYKRYARVLREMSEDVDVIEAFSSVSVGVPLWLAHIRGPKKILRLGGDFLWERATDRGDGRGLREWYDHKPWFVGFMNGLLRTFDTIVFSTHFQEDLYRRYYKNMPPTTVIENVNPSGTPTLHQKHVPLRLLSLGRFVSFKNLPILVEAVKKLPDVTLTIAGSGPMERSLRASVDGLRLGERVTFLSPQHGPKKEALLRDHDVLVVPSKTDISPNTALEARAAGLPVLLTQETGLSRVLLDGMIVAKLETADDVVTAVSDIVQKYDAYAARAAQPVPPRGWNQLADEHLSLFVSLL